jgi:hypothetical protein
LPRSTDSDQEYLVGCMVAGLAGLLVLAFPVVRCLMDQQSGKTIYTTAGLTTLWWQAAVPSVVVGLVASLWGRIPGTFGAFGGFTCGAAYWFLHIQQSISRAPGEIGHFPEYQDSTMWLAALGWILMGAVVCFLPLLRRKA